MTEADPEPGSAVAARLHGVWRQQVEASHEVEQARLGLQFHRRKMREMSEELSSAVTWERELQDRCLGLEETVKPVLLRISDKVERDEVIEEKEIEECLAVNTGSDITTVLSHKVERVVQMERSQLVRLTMTILKVRDGLVNKQPEQEETVVHVQELAERVIRQMGRNTIVWIGLTDWEAQIVRQLVPLVEGVPSFIARIVDQMLGRRREDNMVVADE
jgi:hypothetical protein